MQFAGPTKSAAGLSVGFPSFSAVGLLRRDAERSWLAWPAMGLMDVEIQAPLTLDTLRPVAGAVLHPRLADGGGPWLLALHLLLVPHRRLSWCERCCRLPGWSSSSRGTRMSSSSSWTCLQVRSCSL